MRLEHFRRSVLRPLTDRASEMLRAGTSPPAAEIEQYRIEEHLYNKYFSLFNDLNRTCGVGGDDFEVEEIEDDRLPCVCKTLKNYPRRDKAGKLDTQLDDFIDRLWGLCIRASDAKQSVFLVL